MANGFNVLFDGSIMIPFTEKKTQIKCKSNKPALLSHFKRQSDLNKLYDEHKMRQCEDFGTDDIIILTPSSKCEITCISDLHIV